MPYAKDKLKIGYKGKFVIHDHYAQSHHWDLRLEFPVKSLKDSLQSYYNKRVWKDKNGDPTTEPKSKFPDKSGVVLRSWAIPKHKIPTSDPLLATETEDHDIGYAKFKGEIPEGHYGAGKVKIYDKGTFEIVGMDYDKKYEIKFNGSKLKGYYALIKTSGKKFLWIKIKNTEEYKNKKSSLYFDKRLKGPAVDRVLKYQSPYMLRYGRNYGEYCTDFIEQNALELYLLGRLDEDMGEGVKRLKQRVEDRNPHTKIFQQGIVKLASRKSNYINGEEIINSTIKEKINLLRERRDYGFPKKRKKKKYKSSIITKPQKQMCPQIWDLSQDPPKIYPEIRNKILTDLFNVLEENFNNYEKWIKDVSLVGSIVTNQYKDDTDVDVNISIDYETFKKENPELGKKYPKIPDLRIYIKTPIYELNDELLIGKHPIKYIVLNYKFMLESDAIYSLLLDDWIKPPTMVAINFNPDLEFIPQQTKAQEITDNVLRIINITKTLISDYLKTNDKKILKKINENINILKKLDHDIRYLRKYRFKKDNLKILGKALSKNWEENNIIFKYVEKFGMDRPLKSLKKILTNEEFQLIKDSIKEYI